MEFKTPNIPPVGVPLEFCNSSMDGMLRLRINKLLPSIITLLIFSSFKHF